MQQHTTRAEMPGTVHPAEEVLVAAGGFSVSVVVATVALMHPLLAVVSGALVVLATAVNRRAGRDSSVTVRHERGSTTGTG